MSLSSWFTLFGFQSLQPWDKVWNNRLLIRCAQIFYRELMLKTSPRHWHSVPKLKYVISPMTASRPTDGRFVRTVQVHNPDHQCRSGYAAGQGTGRNVP